LSESYKVCPICSTHNHHNAAVCTTCGTDLTTVTASKHTHASQSSGQTYEAPYGETDLLEGAATRAAGIYMIVALFAFVLIIGAGIAVALNSGLISFQAQEANIEIVTTQTPRPTLDVATVTLGPPTATPTLTPPPTFTPSLTPTQGPCIQRIPPGGTLFTALTNCGHRSPDVMPTVLALNNLADANSIQANQEIVIPWPTPTEGPNAVPTQNSDTEAGASTGSNTADDLLVVDESIQAFAATAVPTLPPGVMWHVVQPNENIISIAFDYNADVKTLSELNREIDFARCDFGETYGGPECIVQLSQGQRLRVPAPPETPTLSPTPDPNATATPTATPTVNIPSIISPTDNAFFYVDELITLRWIPSATLRPGETYRVDVHDKTSGHSYVAFTTDVTFLIPPDWQGQQETRHDYEWTVGIVSTENPEDVRYQTDAVTFVWQGLVEEEGK